MIYFQCEAPGTTVTVAPGTQKAKTAEVRFYSAPDCALLAKVEAVVKHEMPEASKLMFVDKLPASDVGFLVRMLSSTEVC